MLLVPEAPLKKKTSKVCCRILNKRLNWHSFYLGVLLSVGLFFQNDTERFSPGPGNTDRWRWQRSGSWSSSHRGKRHGPALGLICRHQLLVSRWWCKWSKWAKKTSSCWDDMFENWFSRYLKREIQIHELVCFLVSKILKVHENDDLLGDSVFKVEVFHWISCKIIAVGCCWPCAKLEDRPK